MGYQPFVTELLAGVARVHGPEENCQHTRVGLERLDAWLAPVQPTVIHVNHGLHDLARDPVDGRAGEPRVPLEQYKQNLPKILQRLKATGAAVVFALTTPVDDERHAREKNITRYAADVENYNRVARVICRELDVPVNDLYSVIEQPHKLDLLKIDGVHYTDAGSKLLAEHVVNAIRPYLV